MGRGRIEIKKIENINSRQVTFSKRRSGLLKKAKELAVLCDAEVGVIIFSTTGKLYEFASSRMEQILARYNKSRDSSEVATVENADQKELHSEVNALKDELEKLQLMHRRMMGKELEGLSFNELQDLEHILTEGILSVKDKKEKKLLEQLEKSRLQGQKVVLQNEALREQIEELRHHAGLSRENRVHGRKDSCITSSSIHEYILDKEANSDISLHLGLSSVDHCEKRKVPKIESNFKSRMVID
ncbi:Agamous-like MADS-box protein AGL18 [Forsythia ovata]|uniref:Agamous-like MADS-box protein AGL18 n=1 Tax=Forsythia ovata TaxID=205694 RepID=A0ABD1SM05_9LAMI